MIKINSILVDDEPKNLRILRGLLNEFCPQVIIVGEAQSADDAELLIKELDPQLVFLDIEMPFGNAFQLLERIMPVNFEIIFVTAFDNYVLKAFKYSALDYLLKPVTIEELVDAVKRADFRIRQKTINPQLANLFNNQKVSKPGDQKLVLEQRDGAMVFITFNDIVKIRAEGGYTYIHTMEGKQYISDKSVKEYEDMLPEFIFFRIHHSFIINKNVIKKIVTGRGGLVELVDGSKVEVAVRRKSEFMEWVARG